MRTLPTLAAVVASHRAAILWAPAVDAHVWQRVVLTLAATGAPVLPDGIAASLSQKEISAGDVAAAVRRMKGDISPGLDGIILELYRFSLPILAPLLLRLFFAIFSLQRLPPSSTLGLLTCLHKSGSAADPAYYRPITP